MTGGQRTDSVCWMVESTNSLVARQTWDTRVHTECKNREQRGGEKVSKYDTDICTGMDSDFNSQTWVSLERNEYNETI